MIRSLLLDNEPFGGTEKTLPERGTCMYYLKSKIYNMLQNDNRTK